MFKIGNISIKNNVVLAPMAGICNSAFRRIVKEMGVGLVFAEMVSDKAIFYGSEKTIDMLKEEGLWFACADMDGEIVYKTNLKGSMAVVVGNEGSGVSRLVKEKCDYVVKIPMKGHIDSFNVSVATGILLYEINRQRSKT